MLPLSDTESLLERGFRMKFQVKDRRHLRVIRQPCFSPQALLHNLHPPPALDSCATLTAGAMPYSCADLHDLL
jgi:hypothetical protein